MAKVQVRPLDDVDLSVTEKAQSPSQQCPHPPVYMQLVS